MWRSLVHTEGHTINAGPRQRMLDHRNDYSLMALGGHCCWLIVTLALVGDGEACRRYTALDRCEPVQNAER